MGDNVVTVTAMCLVAVLFFVGMLITGIQEKNKETTKQMTTCVQAEKSWVQNDQTHQMECK